MKKIKVRVMTLLLILSLIYSNVAVNASTDEESIKVIPVKENVRLFSSEIELDTSKYMTIEDAANQVRSKVAKHKKEIKVRFKTFISSPTEAYEKFKAELTKETESSSEGDYMFWNIKQEVPNYIYMPINEKRKTTYYYEFHIFYEYYTTLAQRKKVDKRIKSVIKKLGITDKMSNYLKIKLIYEYICKNVHYAYNPQNTMSFTAYSALFYKKAVCQGYAQLMYKMLREVDVPVRLIPGYANGELHGWNIVKVGKYYYNVDVTWDSGNHQKGYGYKNFLKGDSFAQHFRFDNYKDYMFYGKYPMAKYDYQTGKKQLSTRSKRAQFAIKRPKIIKVKESTVMLNKIRTKVQYTIQYSTARNFKNARKVLTTKTKVKLPKLKKKKKYFVRYRASKKIDGKIICTKWSEKKEVFVL